MYHSTLLSLMIIWSNLEWNYILINSLKLIASYNRLDTFDNVRCYFNIESVAARFGDGWWIRNGWICNENAMVTLYC